MDKHISQTSRIAMLLSGLLAVTASGIPVLLSAAEADTAPAQAQQQGAEAPDTSWKGSLELGLSSMKGNADNTSLTMGLNLNRNSIPWRSRIAAQGNKMENDGVTLAESYMADYQLDYVLPNDHYWFGYAGYDSNKFAAIDQRFVEIVGYGSGLVTDKKKYSLDAEMGLGSRQSKFTNGLGESNEAIGHLGVIYSLQVTDNTKFSENLVIQPGSDNSYTTSQTALEVAMSKKTALKLSYSLESNTDVFPGFEKTDASTTASIVVGF